MQSITSIDGLYYKIDSNTDLSPEQFQQTIDSIRYQIQNSRITGNTRIGQLQSCNTCGNQPYNIHSLANCTTCPTSKKLNDILTLNATGSGGNGPYTITFKRNGVAIPGGSFPNIGEGVNKPYSYTISSADVTAGSVTLSADVTNNCGATTTCCQCIIPITAAQGYNCSDCNVLVTGGQFATTAACQTACAVQGYNCSNGNCTGPVAGGTYPTLTQCQSACTAATHLGCNSTTQKCETKTGGGGNTDGCVSIDQACGTTATHTACTGGGLFSRGTCTQVAGAGTNQCTAGTSCLPGISLGGTIVPYEYIVIGGGALLLLLLLR